MVGLGDVDALDAVARLVDLDAVALDRGAVQEPDGRLVVADQDPHVCVNVRQARNGYRWPERADPAGCARWRAWSCRSTRRGRWLADLTGGRRRRSAATGATGSSTCSCPHATAGVALIELGVRHRGRPRRGARPAAARGTTATATATARPGHGADHVLPAFVSPSLSIPVLGGAHGARHVAVARARRHQRRQPRAPGAAVVRRRMSDRAGRRRLRPRRHADDARHAAAVPAASSSVGAACAAAVARNARGIACARPPTATARDDAKERLLVATIARHDRGVAARVRRALRADGRAPRRRRRAAARRTSRRATRRWSSRRRRRSTSTRSPRVLGIDHVVATEARGRRRCASRAATSGATAGRRRSCRRLDAWLAGRDVELHAYGNSPDDDAMLARADSRRV